MMENIKEENELTKLEVIHKLDGEANCPSIKKWQHKNITKKNEKPTRDERMDYLEYFLHKRF